MRQHYAGERIGLLTQHGKEQVIRPVLEAALGCVVERVSGVDTDALGTFTRERPRPGSQLEAARRKARIGMELSGLRVGLGSEGSFGPDPFSGLFPWNVELLVLIDDRLGIEVLGVAQGAAQSGHLQTGDWEAVARFAEQQGLPSHQLVIRPRDRHDPRLRKGIASWTQLQAGFERCAHESGNGHVFVETELRAFANPTRMRLIGEAAEDLRQRLQSLRAACDAPGYWVVEREPGLPCAACSMPTRAWLNEVWQCPRCGHRAVRARADRGYCDPQYCVHCNP